MLLNEFDELVKKEELVTIEQLRTLSQNQRDSRQKPVKIFAIIGFQESVNMENKLRIAL